MRLKLIPRSVYLRLPPITRTAPLNRDNENEEGGAGLKIPRRIRFVVVLTTAISFLCVCKGNPKVELTVL
jgi:hypothetical protein